MSRNLRFVSDIQKDSTVRLSEKQPQDFEVVTCLYEQQRAMYDSRTHRCDDRILVHQPYVRPIVRGKVTAGTEFGAKLTVYVVDGYAEKLQRYLGVL